MSDISNKLTEHQALKLIMLGMKHHRSEIKRLNQMYKNIVFYKDKLELKYYVDIKTNQVCYKIANYDGGGTK